MTLNLSGLGLPLLNIRWNLVFTGILVEENVMDQLLKATKVVEASVSRDGHATLEGSYETCSTRHCTWSPGGS
jgi:hypothetical protein